ncbi:unnamed protein product [Citrullus colocynthis]|uniref:Secreted protein n=1 Tax=Citrullus colocynthis TaxID=252529 RepID=A0ABP0YHC4_9ROSI
MTYIVQLCSPGITLIWFSFFFSASVWECGNGSDFDYRSFAHVVARYYRGNGYDSDSSFYYCNCSPHVPTLSRLQLPNRTEFSLLSFSFLNSSSPSEELKEQAEEEAQTWCP